MGTLCETIHIALVCMGKCSRVVTPMLKSLLHHRQNSLHFHLIVDTTSQHTTSKLFDTWDLPDGKQEYSARTLGATWGIISAIMVPIVIVFICVGWRILKRKKAEEKEEDVFMNIKTRPIDPDESEKINSDEESIPYKKDTEDSPEPTEPVRVVDNDNQSYPYGQPYGQQIQPSQQRQWGGETEIN